MAEEAVLPQLLQRLERTFSLKLDWDWDYIFTVKRDYKDRFVENRAIIIKDGFIWLKISTADLRKSSLKFPFFLLFP